MIFNSRTESLLEPYLLNGFHEMSFENYLHMFGASSHGLMDIRRSPKYYKWRRENPMQSKAMGIGTLVHMLILEPGLAEQRVKVAPKVDRRTKDGKAAYEDFTASLPKDAIVIDADEHQTLMRIRDSLMSHSFAKDVIGRKGATKENVGFWVHEETQVFCKIRPDLMFLADDVVVDIKTTQLGHPVKFQKDMYNFNYDMQAAFYMDGYKAITGKNCQFFFLTVESSGPHDIACYQAKDKVYGFGKTRYEKAIRTFADCFKDDKWPGYAEAIVPLDLPHWVETAEQTVEDIELFMQENL